ncbi:MAG: MBL fold metallo-hydrolase [Desulfarculaceae bacterium]|nr:MBL fold metallo-hydrolase [Desulfarculaceae bacterium]MCF8074231.1 MBL fold metallo-hydrolase [Desulfarculaceae bacterium]MCF8103010.1 MBL fold metallo-hydrolase [Desulfarculaceae bacterium]MCF8117141.1 MBL fold metallo-hydrolase [Desulfarculaceae bacterium]
MANFIPPVQLAPRLWRIGSHHLSAYLIRGPERCALYEVGVAVTAPLILAQLEALGVAREEVAWIILSHAHSDHSAGAGDLLAALPQARLVLTPIARDLLSRASTLGRFSQDNEFSSREVARLEGLAGAEDWPPLVPPPAERLHLAQPGESLMVDGEKVEFLSGEGHVPGGLVCWLPGPGALLASDSAGFRHSERHGFPLYFVSYRRYQANLASIAAREPEVLGMGHQGSLSGPQARDYLAGLARHLAGFHREVCARFQRDQTPAQISAWCFDTFFRDELVVHGAANISYCCDLLVKRSLGHEKLTSQGL